MRSCLIVANQTLGGQHLIEAVEQRIAAEEHSFYVVVPTTPLHEPADGIIGLPGGPSAQERAYALARQRLDTALACIRELGAEADGEVGDPDVLAAVRIALGRCHIDAQEAIVSTLPRGVSRWWRGDLPARIKRATGLPVDHVVGRPDERPVIDLSARQPGRTSHGGGT
jgi:hypothetical protein